MPGEDYVEIPLPKSIIDQARAHIKGTEFKSVPEYVAFVLEEVLGDTGNKDALTEEEERQVKETLKRLGYSRDE